jgi:hypothetical protein
VRCNAQAAVMNDEPFFSPNRKPAPVRLGKPGGKLFEFRHGDDRFICELRDRGRFGVEAQFLLNGDLYIARTFQDQTDFGVRARDLAIAWAEQLRKAKEHKP